jgi:signal transduction histidine kinase
MTRLRILVPILAAALPAFGLAVWLVVQGAAEQRDQIFERHELRARTTAIALTQVVRTQMAEAELLAASPIVTRPGTSDEIRAYLSEFFYVVEDWEVISVIDTEGWIIASTAERIHEPFVGDRPYFQEVVERGEPVVSGPLVARTHQEPSIIVASPVTFEDGSRGALTAALPLEWLQAAVSEHVPATSRVQLVHDDGEVVTESRGPDELSRRAPEETHAIQAALGGHAGAMIVSGPAGDRLTAHAPVEGQRWAVLVSTSAREAFRHANARLRTGLALAALALGAIVALSWSFGGRLAAAMLRVDEARGRAETARRRASLAAEASKRLSAHDSYELTIPAVAELACADLGEEVIVELVDEGGSPRRIGSSTDARPLPLPVTDWIRAHREALLRGDAQVISGKGAREGETVSALVAPVAANERLYGWLVFLTAGAREYEPDELVLAEDLGGRAAMAIVNAELYREARESTLAREHVLSVVAHDLRTPLTSIDLTVATLSRTGAVHEHARPQLERVDRASKQMQRLIRDLLGAARLEPEVLRANVTRCRVVELVRGAMDTYHPLAAEKDIRFSEHLEVGEDTMVWCDLDRVDQVLGNIVSNALRFTPPGGTVSLAARATSEPEITFEISDSGPGISPSELPRIFERFWHGDHGGTGLGLAIAKAIVDANGGRIWAESPPDGGAAVMFTLPVAAPDDPSAEARVAEHGSEPPARPSAEPTPS